MEINFGKCPYCKAVISKVILETIEVGTGPLGTSDTFHGISYSCPTCRAADMSGRADGYNGPTSAALNFSAITVVIVGSTSVTTFSATWASAGCTPESAINAKMRSAKRIVGFMHLGNCPRSTWKPPIDPRSSALPASGLSAAPPDS